MIAHWSSLLFLTPLIAGSLVWRERAALPVPRAGYIAGVLDNRFVFAGGSFWRDDQKFQSDRTDFFDPATNTWSPGPE